MFIFITIVYLSLVALKSVQNVMSEGHFSYICLVIREPSCSIQLLVFRSKRALLLPTSLDT